MAAAIDSLELVKGFLRMLMPLKGEISDEITHTFLRRISRQSLDTDTLRYLFSNMQYISEEKAKALRFTGNAGSFGQFALCATDAKKCYKVVNYSVPGHLIIASNLWRTDIIKEIFVQYIIAEDGLFATTVPSIYNVYKAKYTDGRDIIIIEMSYGTSTMYDYLNKFPIISFNQFYEITKSAFSILQKLNARFGFVHRDFKLNNILLKAFPGGAAGAGGGPPVEAGAYTIQLIDFGMSCINLYADGIEYNIKVTGNGKYIYELPCREQQDVLTYLFFYLDFYAHKSDRQIIEFIRDFIPEDVMSTLAARVERYGKPSAFRRAYNTTGSLLLSEDDREALTIKGLLSALEDEAAGRGIRRSRSRSRSRSRPRLKNRSRSRNGNRTRSTIAGRSYTRRLNKGKGNNH
jgi:serine/threonine protein kinase